MSSFDPFRTYTQARIGLGQQAPALPTKAWLEFAYHHACAKDAVQAAWDIDQHKNHIEKLGFSPHIINTRIVFRNEYLMRPDLGKNLSDSSAEYLATLHAQSKDNVVMVISNGLSSLAVINHLNPFLTILLKLIVAEKINVNKKIFLVENARVGLIDEIGQILKPSIGLVIIGERPGLSSPDSLAVYLTYQPRNGLTDSLRNCLSNIRPPFGQSYEEAAAKTCYLLTAALKQKLSGVALKENMKDKKKLNPPHKA